MMYMSVPDVMMDITKTLMGNASYVYTQNICREVSRTAV